VLASFDHCRSARFQDVIKSLVAHLHAFVEDVRVTEAEWFQAIDYLTRTGEITDAKRQEFVLLSDVLGLSMLVIRLNNQRPTGATESTVFGPFFFEDSPRYGNGGDIANGASGEPCLVSGRVLSVGGEPIPNARVEVWEADDQGFYDSQYEGLTEQRGRGHLFSEDGGRFWFWSVKPVAYPIPGDGPVGELLRAANRSPMRPAHIHFMLTAPGYQPLITHIFAADDPHLHSGDAVFAVRESLIVRFERHEPGIAPDDTRVEVPFYTASCDLVLAPLPRAAARACVFITRWPACSEFWTCRLTQYPSPTSMQG
jgi:hydroxyquinol 1,2-dioxygenase